MNRLKSHMFLLLVMSLVLSMHGTSYKNELTLEHIYRYDRYPIKSYRSVRWMEDHQHYTTLEMNRERNCTEIIRYDVGTGERIVLIRAEDLVPGNTSHPIGVEDYQWSDDNSMVLLFKNTNGMICDPIAARVGRSLPREHRYTALGGLAIASAAKELEKKLKP